MTNAKAVVTAIALLMFCRVAIVADSKIEAEIRQAENKWIAAIKAKDKAALESILSNDLVYTHSTGMVESKAQYIDVVTKGSQNYTSVDYSDTNIRVYGATAVVTTQARMTGSSRGNAFDNKVRLLHVWVKDKGNWTLVAHQTTRLP